jgi:preprotein translocase SecE subunit
MADDKSSKPGSKRRVKNPETFRERALKANEPAPKAAKATAKAKAGRKGGRLSRLGAGLSGFKPLRPVITVLRFIGRLIVPRYLRDSWKELKLVTWPDWKQSRQLTFAVLVFAVVFGAVIAIVDYGLDKIFRNILLK